MSEAGYAASTATAIRAEHEYLASHAEEAQSTDSIARAHFERGLRVTVEGPNGWRVDTDGHRRRR